LERKLRRGFSFLPGGKLMKKPTCVCLIRGINVGGRNIVKMDRLRKAFEALGHESVRTCVQSGNVFFKSGGRAPGDLARNIEKMILDEFGFAVSVIVKTSEEIQQATKRNPFVKEKGIDVSKLHVTFLSGDPGKAASKALDAIVEPPDQFRCSGGEIYLYCPNGYGRSSLTNNALEKVLAMKATTRNWNTLNKLREMSEK
jgi:uncharacterized protein (DUF1697 family)